VFEIEEYKKMKMGKGMIFIVALVVICLGGKWVEAQVHHVVGADRGWDQTSDLVSWAAGRVFRVGDQICKSLILSLFIYQIIGKCPVFCSVFFFNTFL